MCEVLNRAISRGDSRANKPDQIRNGSAVFYVMGVILYEDTLGSRYHTTFCRTYDPDALTGTGGFVHPRKPGYNYGS